MIEDRLGIHHIDCALDIEAELLKAYETMTSAELTDHARSLGLAPPTEDPHWRIGILQSRGRNRAGEEVVHHQGLIWSAPDFPFSRDLDRKPDEEDAWPDDLM